MRFYSKLNKKPNPEKLEFQKKDDIGKILDTSSGKIITYRIDYTPCEFNEYDILYLTVVGFEGKSNYTLTVSLIYNQFINVLCSEKKSINSYKNETSNFISREKKSSNYPPLKLMHYSSVLTSKGTIRFGGILNKTLDDRLFLYNSTNEWEIINVKNDFKPCERYGHNMFYFEDYLILFAGKDKNDNILSDLWVFDLNENNWIEINYKLDLDNNSRNVYEINKSDQTNQLYNYQDVKFYGIKKYLSSGTVLKNLGKILIFGGSNNFDDKNIYLLDLKNLIEVILFYKRSLNKKQFFSFQNKNEEKNEAYELNFLLKNIWNLIKIEELTPRYGHSITQINNQEIMLFGGIDRNLNYLSTLEILNLKTLKTTIIEPNNSIEFPKGRGFHQIEKFGPILILIGGENAINEVNNDIWKFAIDTYKWIKLEIEEDIQIFLKKSNFFFTKIFMIGNLHDRLALYGGYGGDRESTNDFILLNFDVCPSPIGIASKTLCYPCSEGYIYNSITGKCEGCPIGYYHDFNNYVINKDYILQNMSKSMSNSKIENTNIQSNTLVPSQDTFNQNSNLMDNYYNQYFNSKCAACPKKTSNDKFSQAFISSCKLCDYGSYNNLNAQLACFPCSKNEICLPGTESPIKMPNYKNKNNLLNKKVMEYNYPDFLDSNSEIQYFTKLTGFLVLISIVCMLLVILAICYYFRKKRVLIFLIYMDFVPLTGGVVKKANGGLITLIYLAKIISFTIFFIIRFLYFNKRIEVISLTHSIEDINTQDFSLKIKVDLIGYEYNCINNENHIKENFYECHPDLEITKIDKSLLVQQPFFERKSSVFCSLDKETNICRVNIECKECSNVKNEDEIEIFLKNPNSLIQAYGWKLESYWSNDFDEENGYSKIYSSFFADKEFQ